MFDRHLLDPAEYIRRDRQIGFPPIDIGMDTGRIFKELVLGATTSALAGVDVERAVGCQIAFSAENGEFDQPGGRKVAMDCCVSELDDRCRCCGRHDISRLR